MKNKKYKVHADAIFNVDVSENWNAPYVEMNFSQPSCPDETTTTWYMSRDDIIKFQERLGQMMKDFFPYG
jgi:hypothetical protein